MANTAKPIIIIVQRFQVKHTACIKHASQTGLRPKYSPSRNRAAWCGRDIVISCIS